MSDRRSSQRFKLHQMVKITGLAEEVFVSSIGIDISQKGMLCEIEGCPMDPYEKLFLMFDVGAHKELKAEGIVMRIDHDDEGRCFVGIEFTDVDPVTARALDELGTHLRLSD